MLMTFMTMALAAVTAAGPRPISLHPENPRYFLFRGDPTVLITSAEHYGAVLNLDFQQKPYLDELKRSGMNYTRIFTGAYCESPGDFQIRRNTLAPEPGRLIAPWARSSEPGYAGGGNRFDLTRWNDAYFERLHTFVDEAGKRGIVVEVSLFCPFYADTMWNLSPMRAANNVNQVGNAGREEVYALKHDDLTRVQDALVRRIVQELRECDNVFYEICNEPYFGGVTLEWQRHIAQVIVSAEAAPGHRHLVAQNIANGSARVEDPDRNVSILNFHYANPPSAIAENARFRGVIGCDETGFKGQGDSPYREEGWEFIMAGGALYNNLDYSFTTRKPDGTEPIQAPTPGGGGRTMRAGLNVLRKFIESFDFIHMKPDAGVVGPKDVTVRALSIPGKQVAAYIRGGTSATIGLNLPEGRYEVAWVDTRTGEIARRSVVRHKGGILDLDSPTYAGDIALSIGRK